MKRVLPRGIMNVVGHPGILAWAAIASGFSAGAVVAGSSDPATADPASASAPAAGGSLYDFTVKDIDGKDVALSKYKGDVLLIVNTASQCGLTPQYSGLESMFKKYKDQGFRVLAFPSNNFNGQEPGTNEEIKQFCASKYQVSFDLFAKISVAGDDQAPLYKFLTNHQNKDVAGKVEWNFQKYLVGRDGTVIAKFNPRTKPDDSALGQQVEQALAAPKPEAKSEKAPG